MADEYDFSGGVQGKHAHAYRRGYTIQVKKADGSIETRGFVLPDGAILLDPDVRAYFPDSQAVNRALRGLIQLIPQKPA
ncbi:MAG TPA: hypothetical protein VKQ36_11480 [Ktedonobacterales bacterium]|nr:hypothetical protein [Ktedonobacterales bacterium]